MGFNAAEYGEWIAVLVYAYDHGGTTVAAFVAAVQLVPCVIAAPVFAGLADRHPPGRVLVAGYVAMALGMGVTAVVMLAGAPPAAVYVAAIVAAVPFTIVRPTQSALLRASPARRPSSPRRTSSPTGARASASSAARWPPASSSAWAGRERCWRSSRSSPS